VRLLNLWNDVNFGNVSNCNTPSILVIPPLPNDVDVNDDNDKLFDIDNDDIDVTASNPTNVAPSIYTNQLHI
jgi:hypothetical protein